MTIENKLKLMGLVLPDPIKIPSGITISFSWARMYNDRVYLSGHGPLNADGTMPKLLGKVGAEVTYDEACGATLSATLNLLSSLKRLIGDLDRVSAWLMINGMVNVAPGFTQTTNVINPCSDLLIELYGPEIGMHARSAVGMAQLPQNLPVIISAEVAVLI